MRKSLAIISAALLSSATGAAAADKSFEGQGFDCEFLTEVGKVETLRFWYGGLRYKNEKAPQFEDQSGLFIVGGMTPGRAISFYVADKWPDEFQVQFFDKNGGATPLSLLSIYGTEGRNGSYRSEISHLPPDLSAGQTVKPTRRIFGMCTTTMNITYEAFRS